MLSCIFISITFVPIGKLVIIEISVLFGKVYHFVKVNFVHEVTLLTFLAIRCNLFGCVHNHKECRCKQTCKTVYEYDIIFLHAVYTTQWYK